MNATATASGFAERLDRLPFSAWHVRLGTVVGSAYFFDAFDALILAVALPVFVTLWHLTPLDVGYLIAVGNVGQAIGSIAFGKISDKFGRIVTSMATVLIFSALSLLCGFATGPYLLMGLRFLQGLALGGEIPVMQTYMTEMTPSRFRGGFIVAFQTLFTTGIAAASLLAIWVIPTFGWQWMFVIGAAPALIVIVMRLYMPESPRWLAAHGRIDEAQRVMDTIERVVSRGGIRPLPPVVSRTTIEMTTQATYADLFRGIYRRRTFVLWTLWLFVSIVSYGIANWMPTIYRTVIGMSLSQALQFNFITLLGSIAGCLVCALIVDRVGRKAWICGTLALGFAALVFLAQGRALSEPLMLTALTIVFSSIVSCVVILGTYTSENYPTALRGSAVGVANSWQRIAAVLGPIAIGWILQNSGLSSVYAMLATSAVLGAAVCLFGGTETRGRRLEEISPWPLEPRDAHPTDTNPNPITDPAYR